jgi:NADPH:quinone reductase-like Zn-dependent oxidoreductase
MQHLVTTSLLGVGADRERFGMQQIVIPKAGAPSVLTVVEGPDPKPGRGEVRVRVAAAGVNFADLLARMGLYPDAPPLPTVVGYEVSGTIDDVGDDVPETMLGERVLALCRFGGYASTVVLPLEQVVPLDDTLPLVEAAAVPVVTLTAWMMLEIMGRVREGDRVLVHSAGGGVGLAAHDLLRFRRCVTTGVASEKKHAFLRERGFDALVTNDDVARLPRNHFDLVLDPIGGRSWSVGLDLLRAGGRLICFGMSSMSEGKSERSVMGALGALASVPWTRVNPVTLMNTNKGVLGVNMGRLWDDGPRVTSWLTEIVALWREGVIRPVVHATVPFGEAARAHEMLHARENIGKVLLIPDR